MEENLQLCLVRQAPSNIDRACCFELVTPSKSHLLQADSEALCSAWIKALQRTIQHLHESGQGYKSARHSVISSVNDATTPTSSKGLFLNGGGVNAFGGSLQSTTIPASLKFSSSVSSSTVEVSPKTKRREQAQIQMKKRMQEHLAELLNIPGLFCWRIKKYEFLQEMINAQIVVVRILDGQVSTMEF